jgi:hypothetical protein
MAANRYSTKLIAAPPALIQTLDGTVAAFLAGLPAPDFRIVANPKALWATEADDLAEGSVIGGGTLSTWVVSAETLKRVKAHRY